MGSLPDRDQKRAEEVDKTWAEANEVFKRDVLGMQPVDLSAAFVETAKDKERLRVQDDLCRAGVPEGCAEWDEAMAAADQRAAGFAAKEVAEVSAFALDGSCMYRRVGRPERIAAVIDGRL